jgi:hypothetical protein
VSHVELVTRHVEYVLYKAGWITVFLVILVWELSNRGNGRHSTVFGLTQCYADALVDTNDNSKRHKRLAVKVVLATLRGVVSNV